MKRTILILLCLVCLCVAGCGQTKPVKIAEYLNDESFAILDENNPPVSLFCNLGSGQLKTISDPEAMVSIFDTLQKVRLNTHSTAKNLHISDGDICFIFTLKDGKEIAYNFLTSTYFYDGTKYITVNDSSVVRDAMKAARYAEDSAEEPEKEPEKKETAPAVSSPYSLTCEKGDISIEYIDNGDEAPSVIVFTPYWNGQPAYIDGGYSIENVEETGDGFILTCTCGDFYSHERLERYLLTVEGDDLKIEAIDAA